jgi:hypothetical protein
MAEERVITQAANEIVEEVAQTTSTWGGKTMLIIGGFCIGLGAGYYFSKKLLETKYSELAEAEIKEMREHYLAKEKERDEKKPDLDTVMTEMGYKTKLEGPDEVTYVKIDPSNPGDEVESVIVTPEPEVTDIDVWDYKLELPSRSENVPYVIHRDEFFGEETPYEQIQLTYYEGDDVLADSHDTPVDDQDAMVGLGNLSKFGHGSQDPNIVYIRNHELQLEIEISHHDGKFAEEVHGFSDDELKHSHRRQRKQRRFDDE